MRASNSLVIRLAKSEANEQVRTHRFDPLYCIERMVEARYRFRALFFFMLTYWGIFIFVVGLMFYEKNLGNITENLFWAYFFIIGGLMLIIKAGVVILARPK